MLLFSALGPHPPVWPPLSALWQSNSSSYRASNFHAFPAASVEALGRRSRSSSLSNASAFWSAHIATSLRTP